jgi:hypothetical protein
MIIAVICILCVVVLIFGTTMAWLYISRNTTDNNQAQNAPTSVPTAVPTTVPSSTAALPSPTVIPSPTAVPTAVPDPGFAWCGQPCLNNGFQTEYLNAWQIGIPSNASGSQFTNPSQLDQYAAFKTLGPTTSTAKDLLRDDLQNNFTSRPGATTGESEGSTTIGGTTWLFSILYFQNGEQRERVIVYATVYQGKGYVINLQAADAQFEQINTQVFIYMLGKFQFRQTDA